MVSVKFKTMRLLFQSQYKAGMMVMNGSTFEVWADAGVISHQQTVEDVTSGIGRNSIEIFG